MKQPYCTQLDTEGNEKTGGEDESWNLCGAEFLHGQRCGRKSDFLTSTNLQLHDILVFERVGAYSVTEGIYLFLSRPLPRIYFWTEGEGLRMVRMVCTYRSFKFREIKDHGNTENNGIAEKNKNKEI